MKESKFVRPPKRSRGGKSLWVFHVSFVRVPRKRRQICAPPAGKALHHFHVHLFFSFSRKFCDRKASRVGLRKLIRSSDDKVFAWKFVNGGIMVEENVSLMSIEMKSGNIFPHTHFTHTHTQVWPFTWRRHIFYTPSIIRDAATFFSFLFDKSKFMLCRCWWVIRKILLACDNRASCDCELCNEDDNLFGSLRSSRASQNLWMASQKNWKCLIDKAEKKEVIIAEWNELAEENFAFLFVRWLCVTWKQH